MEFGSSDGEDDGELASDSNGEDILNISNTG